MDNANDIRDTLLSMADERQAQQMLRFFKTGPGEYGEGDIFIGLKNPQVRLVVKEVWKTVPLSQAAKLVASPYHEVRLCGLLIMVEQYQNAGKTGNVALEQKIFDTYLFLHPYINNWDLVDLSAIKIVGNHEATYPDIDVMEEWIRPAGHTLWQQRIAMVSTWMLIRHGRPDACFRRVGVLLSSPHELLHKAAGWMLREAWKHNYQDDVRNFLEENVGAMPSVMLSYACEQMAASERSQWQSLRKVKTKSRTLRTEI